MQCVKRQAESWLRPHLPGASQVQSTKQVLKSARIAHATTMEAQGSGIAPHSFVITSFGRKRRTAELHLKNGRISAPSV